MNIDNLTIYSENVVNRKPDIFAFVLQFLTSRFTDNPRLFWGVVSLIHVKLMLMFLNECHKHFIGNSWGRLHYVFIGFLVLVVPFYVGVTGVRFWPALFLYSYFLLKYINNRNFKYIVGASLCVLIHYSFFIPVLFLLLLHILPFLRPAGKILMAISIFYFTISSTTTIFNQLNEGIKAINDTTISKNVEGYVDEEIYAEKQQKLSQRNWYVSLKTDAVFYILVFATLLEALGVFKLRETFFSNQLFSFILIFFCFTLITYNLGSLGRFMYIFFLLAFARYAIIYTINKDKLYIKALAYTLFPTLILYVLVSFRAGFYTVDPLLLINNSISLFFMESEESLSQFLVGH
ncbi:MAG: hypothetical protein ACNS60_10440 [Candidatus Cyclobacteriaceae bacterium M2_1C_046]